MTAEEMAVATAMVKGMTTATTMTMARTASMTRMPTGLTVTAVVTAFLPDRHQSIINNKRQLKK